MKTSLNKSRQCFARLSFAGAAIGTFKLHNNVISNCGELFIGVVSTCLIATSALCASENALKPAAPLVLELRVAYYSAVFHQEFSVVEEGDFRVVTQANGLRWHIEGHVGRVVNGVAPVTLSYGAYASSAANIFAFGAPFQLKVGEYGPSPGGGWRLRLDRLWLRRGVNAVPSLRRTIARRGAHFVNAVQYLGELGDKAKPAVPELIGVLSDERLDDDVEPADSSRRAAAEALGDIGPAALQAVESLLAAAHDANPYLRLDSALALWKVAARAESVAVAITGLSHHDRFVRYQAAQTLREMGAGSEAAVPALLAGLTDPDGYMRVEAARALWAIRRDPASLPCLRDVGENNSDLKVRELANAYRREIEGQQPPDLAK